MSNIANRVFTCLLSRLVVHRVLHEGTKVLDTGSVLAMIGGFCCSRQSSNAYRSSYTENRLLYLVSQKQLDCG